MARRTHLPRPSCALLLVFTGGCCAFSAPPYRGPTSDHFDGHRFFNQSRVPPSEGPSALLRWQLDRQPGPWADWTDAEPGPRPPERVPPGAMRVTFVNHATVLIQLDAINVLADPVWSDRVSPVSWAGPVRHRPPGIRFEDLPPIDAVILSHNHYDHMDVPTLVRLVEVHRPKIYCGLGNATYLAKVDVPGARDLDWWQRTRVGGRVFVTAVPAEHFSRRGMCDGDETLWAGYVLQGDSGAAYFAGDTGFGPHFAQIHERFGPVRLALLPIGAFRPEWFMKRVHISPDDAIRAAQALQAEVSVPIHHGTFRLGDDGQTEPVERLQAALQALGAAAPEFWVLGFGEGRDLPAR